MSKINNGGPAFPCCDFHDGEGMSLRDYFAAKAMQALIGSQSSMQGIGLVLREQVGDVPAEEYARLAFQTIANVAFRAADSMLAEREK